MFKTLKEKLLGASKQAEEELDPQLNLDYQDIVQLYEKNMQSKFQRMLLDYSHLLSQPPQIKRLVHYLQVVGC